MKLLKVFKSFLNGKYYARKFCIHCEEDFDNLCLRRWLSNASECTLFKKYIYCKGRNPQTDDRWIF